MICFFFRNILFQRSLILHFSKEVQWDVHYFRLYCIMTSPLSRWKDQWTIWSVFIKFYAMSVSMKHCVCINDHTNMSNHKICQTHTICQERDITQKKIYNKDWHWMPKGNLSTWQPNEWMFHLAPCISSTQKVKEDLSSIKRFILLFCPQISRYYLYFFTNTYPTGYITLWYNI